MENNNKKNETAQKATTGAGATAELSSVFFKTLISNGVPSASATAMTCAYINALFANTKK